MKYIPIEEKKPNLTDNRMIVVKLTDTFGAGYTLLFAVGGLHPYYIDEHAERVPVSAIREWIDVTP